MAEPIVVNPSPKTKFMASADQIKRHRELMQNGNLIHALDQCLLQYQLVLAIEKVDFNGAAANQFRLRGALEFMHLLKSFAESPPASTQVRVNDNLAAPESAKIGAQK